MALAPASIVCIIVSDVGPPVAIIGTVGYSLLIFLTISGVFDAADTFSMDTPLLSLLSISAFSDTTVITMGISIHSYKYLIVSLGVGAFRTTPTAP